MTPSPSTVIVKRDGTGRIIGVCLPGETTAGEPVARDDPELARFLEGLLSGADRERAAWIESDLAMVRVLEDLIEALIVRGVLSFDELPEMARRKILTRQGRRKELAYVESLFPDDPDSLAGGDAGRDYL